MTDFTRPIRCGTVGGNIGGFISGVHRIAAAMDGHFTLAADALSSQPDNAHTSARQLGIDPDCSYADWREMAKG